MDSSNGHVMNLANSIIGVSVLAMPYCFKQCGIMLSILMLIISSIVSRLACHYLLKSAIMSRRKTFEFLAFHIFGSIGKLSVEMGMIGFLLGTCIAFIVVMGDLGPEIIAEITNTNSTDTMRTSILMALALFVILPLGLLRNVSSLNGVSRATIGFYCCLVLKVIFEAIPHVYSGDWYKNVNFWRTEGILQCLPIFSMALFCQTQLFEVYQTVQNATLEKMNNLICVAVNICTSVYILVGVFGYIAFADKPFTGNILLSFSPSFMTAVMKIGFIISVAFSFPLVIFPCRASLYSLFYKEGYSLHEGVSNYISEARFKSLTILIVLASLIIGIMIPNIEFVLGLVGSTIGVMICVIFPATCFISISPKSTNERLMAQLMLMIGIFVMILGTYKNLSTINNFESTIITLKPIGHMESGLPKAEAAVDKLPSTLKIEIKSDIPIISVTDDNKLKEIRHEPPQPVEPIEENIKDGLQNEKNKLTFDAVKLDIPEAMQKKQNYSKNEEVDIEAIKKEDKEELSQKRNTDKNDDHQILIDTIQKQNQVQKEIVEQQKKLIEVIQNQQRKDENKHDIIKEEKLKAVKEIESIALKAIEKISDGEDSRKVMEEMKENIQETELKNLPVLEDSEKNNNRNSSVAGKIESKSIQQERKKKLGSESDNDVERKIAPSIIPENINVNSGKGGLKIVKSQSDAKVGEITDNQIRNEEAKINGAARNGNLKNSETGQQAVNALNSKIQLKNITGNNSNNTAPLFLSLGKVEEKKKIVDPQQILPLPVAVANSLRAGRAENINQVSNDLNQDQNSLLKDNQSHGNEVQDIRRDILGLSTRK